MSLVSWFKGTSVNRSYTVSDITDATKMTGPLPVAIYSGGAAGDATKAEDAAHTSGDAGVFVLGVRNDSAATTFAGTDGDYSAIAVSSVGRMFASIGKATASADSATNTLAYTVDEGGTVRLPPAANFIFNGTTWDRERNNIDHGTVGITAAGATTTQTGADQTNYNHRGAIIVLDMTTVGTGNVTLTVQAKDALSGKYHTIFTGAAVSTNSTNVYTIYPGVTAAANAAVSYPLPRTWRVTVTANNANATTYTVGANLIL